MIKNSDNHSITTELSYNDVLNKCRDLFHKKHHEYKESWRVLRLESLHSQIYIKAYRVRSIQEKGTQKISDSIYEDLIGIINYSIFGLILEKEYIAQKQIESNAGEKQTNPHSTYDMTNSAYDQELEQCNELYLRKNHDYGNIWRELSVGTCIDFILMKIMRMRSMSSRHGSIISEGYRANYLDIINYAVFAYILNSCKES